MAAVPPIEPSGIGAGEIPYAVAQVGGGRGEADVHVVAHQAERQALPIVHVCHVIQTCNERRSVVIVDEDVPVTVAADHDVVRHASSVKPYGPAQFSPPLAVMCVKEERWAEENLPPVVDAISSCETKSETTGA